MEAPGFDADILYADEAYCTWLACYPDVECLHSVLQNLYPDWSSVPIQRKFDMGMYFPIMDASEALRILGLDASDRRLAILRSTDSGKSMLYHIAECLTYSRKSDGIKHRQSWISLGAEILRNNTDALSVELDEYLDKGVSIFAWLTMTPLLVCVGAWHWKIYYTKEDLEEALEKVQLWAGMVHQAGIDLCQYGAREAKVWKSLKRYKEKGNGVPVLEMVTVNQLLFGPTPADWSLVVQARPLRFEILELQDPPGSFPRDQRIPTKVFWGLHDEEEDEGIWRKVAVVTKPSKPMELESAITGILEEEKPFFIEMVDDTQDDAGAISLLQLRADRASRSWGRRTLGPRSNSQPASLHRRNFRKHQFYTRHKSRTSRLWLAHYHRCLFGSKWRLDHNEPVRWCHDEDFVKCVWSKTCRLALLVQESFWWKQESFLGLIKRCQKYDGLPSDLEWLRARGHNGRPDCPQKCRMVDLEMMHVPEQLKPYHPYPCAGI